MDGSGIILSDTKCSTGMRKGLDEMTKLLRCPICKDVLDNPTTLPSCAHAFCVECIDSHSRKQRCAICPVCRMPVFLNGGGGKTFKPHAELKQMVDSLKEICTALDHQPNHWWTSVPVPQVNEFDDDYDDEETTKAGEESDDDEEMVDLQKGYVQEEISFTEDEEGECGDDSDSE